MTEYAGQQFVGIDLHRRRSVIVRTTESGEVLEATQILNDVDRLNSVMARSGEDPEVVLEATYGWYWAVDALQAAGARVHLAHPLGVKAFEYRRVKNDVRDATDLADLLRMARLPEAWIAPPATRELRELVRHRAKLVGLRTHCKAEVHAVLAKAGIQVLMSDLFSPAGNDLLDRLPLPDDSADVIVCALALVHVRRLEPVLAEFARVLRPGGDLVISDVHHELVTRGSVIKARGPEGEPCIVTTYRHQLGDYLRAALSLGLQVKRCEEPSAAWQDGPLDEPATEIGDWRDWPWSLMGYLPSAARAAGGRPLLVIWHFQLPAT
jgi:SAM-dependent methyltransferase